QTYHGNCHCGSFKFKVDLPELREVSECNCSICFRKGYKWLFPKESPVIVERGEGTLKEYTFGSETMSHKFCPKCGTPVLAQRKGLPAGKGIGLNARSLMDVDLWSLKVNQSDGAARDPQYQPHRFTGENPVPTIEIENPKLYTGSCHCGAHTLAFITNGALPGGKEYIQECDCSICARNGTILIYLHPSQVSITDEEKLALYSFGRKFQTHNFCATCGVAIWLAKLDIGEERWKEEHPNVPYERHLTSRPLNLRLLDGVEWKEIEV
ncbi:Mss4-like protein, partial [Bisporella sp. PMI_857]